MPPGLPNPPQTPIIIPRQPGESEYQYRKRRSVELTGETPYQRRVRLGRARGLSTQQARGHRQSETARRRQQSFARYGLSPWQFWSQNQQQWLLENGWTPETTGWSWNRLIRIAPRLRWLADNTTPSGQITPDMVREASDLESTGVLPINWGWDTLNEKYQSTYDYVELNDRQSGRGRWIQYRIPEMPVQWWYYHP